MMASPRLPASRPRSTVRQRLAALVAACVIPMWLCSGMLIHYATESKQRLLRHHMVETARALALAVDGDLGLLRTVMHGLSTSPLLERDKFSLFNARITKLLHNAVNQATFLVTTPDGRMVYTASLPPDRPLPPPTGSASDTAPRPDSFPIVYTAATGQLMIRLQAPVILGGQRRYTLTMIVPATRLLAVLIRHPVDAHWDATVIDRANRVITCTRMAGCPIGRPISVLRAGHATRNPADETEEIVNPQGVPYLVSLARGPQSGFGVLVSVPRQIVLGELWEWLRWIIGGTLALSLLGLVAALTMGRSIARSIQSLIPPARALGNGTPLDLPPCTLAETQAVAEALENAAQLLQTRANERANAERQREVAEERLRERDRIFGIVADNSANWEYWVSPDGVCRWVSPSCERISGYSPAAFLIGWVTLQSIIAEEDRDLWNKHILAVNRAEEPHEEIYVRIRRADGAIVHIGHRCENVYGVDGTPLGRRGSNRDVTEQLRIERDLKAAKEQADAANRAKSEFLANMSHEIRTPLTGVQGMLHVLEDSPLDAEQRECVRMASKAATRLTRLLSDILDLSRIEAGTIPLLDTVFSLADVRQAVLDIFAPMAGNKGLHLDFFLDPALPDRLIGDDARLRQILLNLVGNAVKYTDTGAIRVRAMPTETPLGPNVPVSVTFSVADTGRGIAPDKLKTIFDRFVQIGARPDPHGGVGLGLAIVQRLTRLMGGTITVDSALDQGTTMRVTLPFAPVPPDYRPPAATPAPPTDRPPRSLAILVVEDDAINQLAIHRLLTKAGHRTTRCANGAQALDSLAKEPFDLVLMDIQMPVMDGLEATRHIRSEHDGRFDPTIPVVAMTAYAMRGDREKCLAAGMDAYVSKPVDPPQLLHTIAQVMANRVAPPA